MNSATRPGVSIWNNEVGWTMPPMPTLKEAEVALVINPSRDTISEWEAEEITQKLGYTPSSRYLGKNDVNDPLATEIYLYLGTYTEIEQVRDRVSELKHNGIPENAIKLISESVPVVC